jgi:phage terminase small subunit
MPQRLASTVPHNLRWTTRLAPPPDHLDPEEQALFRQVIAEFQIDDSGSISLLVTAMECHQRCRRARERVDEDGETVLDRFRQLRPHPCIAIERDARDGYLRAMRALNLKPSTAAR